MGFNSGFKGLIAQHVSSDTPLIIRSSNCNCSLWFYIRLWLPAAIVCKIRGWNYNFWAPDGDLCVARNML